MIPVRLTHTFEGRAKMFHRVQPESNIDVFRVGKLCASTEVTLVKTQILNRTWKPPQIESTNLLFAVGFPFRSNQDSCRNAQVPQNTGVTRSTSEGLACFSAYLQEMNVFIEKIDSLNKREIKTFLLNFIQDHFILGQD